MAAGRDDYVPVLVCPGIVSAAATAWQPVAAAVRQHGCEAWLVDCKVDVEVCWAGLSPGD